jgi:hypothetical protein
MVQVTTWNTLSMPVCAASSLAPISPTSSVMNTNCACSTRPTVAAGSACAMNRYSREGLKEDMESGVQQGSCSFLTWQM